MSWSRRNLVPLVLGLTFALGASPAVAAEPAKPRPEAASPLAECGREERAANELLTRLRERERELDESARRLTERERSADAVEQETGKRLSELEALRAALDERIASLDARADEHMGKLADVYGRMPPERGAAVLDALDPDLAARSLARRRPARSAALLAALTSARAAELSRRLLRPQTGAPRGSEPVAQAAPARVKTGTAASVP